MKHTWNNPLPFGDSHWVKKSDVEPLVIAVRRLLANIYEFGTPTDDVFADQVDGAMGRLTSGTGEPAGDVCMWEQIDDEGSDWESFCGDAWYFESGSPQENNIKFCPFCGRRVEVKFYEPDIREGDEEEPHDV
jgi:hypothetical protein